MNYIITQVIGALAYILLGYSFFRKNKKEILFAQIFAYILFSIHYFMLDGITGAMCNLLGLVALVAIYLFDKYKVKNKKILIIGMIPIYIVIGIISYQNIFSIFPIIASIVTISSFLTSKEKTIRGIGIVSTVCWLVYAVILRSPVTVLFEVLLLIFVTGAFVKHEK